MTTLPPTTLGARSEERAPILQPMGGAAAALDLARMEDTPSYRTLLNANLLTTKYRKRNFDDIFTGIDLQADSSKQNDLQQKIMHCYCVPILGCILYNLTHTEIFVPAGHVGLCRDEKQAYLFAQPGMHNIRSLWIKHQKTVPLPLNNQLQHGNRCILVVEQGYVGLAFDKGQPVLFPPGIHVWTSETLKYKMAVSLDKNIISLGPYTLLTVDEGYAAVTQNNGKQTILAGGATHLLDHKNWRFEKFLSLKIQTDDLEKIEATSADNITMLVTSTVTWRIWDPKRAATMAAETMATTGGKVHAGIPKLRSDVLKQAIASLASFMGGVNYSDSFHIAAKAQQAQHAGSASGSAQGARRVVALDGPFPEPEGEEKTMKADNPLYDTRRMSESVVHANSTTKSYGVEILSINILSAVPVDEQLTKALACGAVASAEALQAETAARGNAKAMRIDADATAAKARIEAEGEAQAEVIEAKAKGDASRLVAEGNKAAADLLSTSQVAVELAKMDKSALMLGKSDKFFFGQEPAYLSNIVLKDGAMGGSHGGRSVPAANRGGMFG